MTGTPAPTEDSELLAQLTMQRQDLEAAKAKIVTQIAELDETLTPLLVARGGRFELAPGVGYRVQGPSRRFKPDLLPALLGDSYLSRCVFPPQTSAQARSILPGAIVDACMVADQGGDSVRGLR